MPPKLKGYTLSLCFPTADNLEAFAASLTEAQEALMCTETATPPGTTPPGGTTPPNTPPTAMLAIQSGQLDSDTWQFLTAGTGDPGGAIAQTTIVWGDGSANYSIAGPPAALVPHTWPTGPGTYTIAMTVVDSGGLSQTQVLTVQVVVATQPPIAVLTFVSGSFTGALVTLSTTGTSFPGGAAATYTLNWGDGTVVGPTAGAPPASPTHTYATAGTYTVTLTVVDSYGETDSVTMPVLVQDTLPGAPPTASLALTSGAFVGDSFVFTANGSDPDLGAITWNLDFGNGTHVNGTGADFPATLQRSYLAVGSYTATLRVTDVQGLIATATVAVTVAPLPNPDPVPANQSPVAALAFSAGQFAGAPYTLSTTGTYDLDNNAATWSLAWGDGSTPSGGAGLPPTQVSHTYAAAGTYTAVLTVTDTAGLVGTTSLTVIVQAVPATNQAPVATVVKTSGYYTGAFSFTLAAADPDGTLVSYVINPGDGSAPTSGSGTPPASFLHTYTVVAASRTLTLQVTDNQGAVTSASVTFAVVQSPPAGGGPHAYFDAMPARSDYWKSYSLRPRAGALVGDPYYANQLRSYANGGYSFCNSCALEVLYNPSADTNADKQDAAKISIPTTTNSLRNQLRVPMGTADGNVYVVTWDGYWTPSYLPSITLLRNHKAFQLGSDGIFFEVRTRFDGGNLANGGSGPIPGFNPALHIAAIDARTYNSIGGAASWASNPANAYGWAGPSVTRDQPILPQAGLFILKKQLWTRFWLRFDQRANDYDLVSLWVADENTDAVQIINNLPVSTRGTTCEDFWLEFNTSTDAIAPGRGPMVNYMRNIAMLRNVADMTPLFVRPLPGPV